MAIADNMPNDRPQDLPRRISDLERAVRELRAAHTIDRSTITPAPGMGIRTGDFDGTDFAHPGTQGNYFGGDGAVLNDLYLRPGSIGNAALTDPVVQTTARASSGGFAIATTYAERAGIDVIVPTGCSQVQAVIFARLYVVNANTTGGSDGAGGDAIYAKGFIGSSSTTATPTGLTGNYGFTTNSSNDAFTITGLHPGDTLHIATQVKCNYAPIPAYTDNLASVVAALTWLR